jgi:cytochrome c oxidase subunit 4
MSAAAAPHQHIDSVKTYALVFIGLITLTVFTTAVAFVDLGSFSVIAALVIAVCKAMLVALFFMHLRHSTILTRLVVISGLLWLLILLLLTLADYTTRGVLGVPGR